VNGEGAFRRRGGTGMLAAAFAVLLLAAALGIALGARPVPFEDVIRALASMVLPFFDLDRCPEAHAAIVLDLRLPRVAQMAVIGAALSAAGAAYQGLFRNPLADPYTVGVASGAGFGATAVIMIWSPAAGYALLGVPAGAFAGGVGTVVLVLALSRSGRSTPATTMLLSGVAIGAFATALSTFWMLRAPDGVRRAFGWLLGGYTGGGWGPVAVVAPYLAAGLLLVARNARALNVLQLDEERALELGVDVERVKLGVVAGATLMTAAAVAFGGIISFVGLVVPHILRLLGVRDYRSLVPLSAVAGASFLIGCDLLARIALAPEEVPVGVITSLAGAPFFVYLLRHADRSGFGGTGHA
jgi:iron complex transport system permease protein